MRAAAGIAVADSYRQLLICFAKSSEYPAHEDVRVGAGHFFYFWGYGIPPWGENGTALCGGYGTFPSRSDDDDCFYYFQK